MKKKILNLLKIGISAFLMWLLFKKIGFQEIYNATKEADITLLAIGFLLTFLGYILQATRLMYLANAQKIRASFVKLLQFNLMSTFFGIFLPTTVGGDIFKIGFLGKHSGKKTTSAATIIADRAVGVYALSFIASVAILFGYSLLNNTIIYFVFAIFALSFLSLVVLYNRKIWKLFLGVLNKILPKKIIDIAGNFVVTIQSFKPKDIAVQKAFFFSILFYFSTIVANLIVARSLGLNINPVIFFVFVPILSLSGMIPISLSGLGVRETVSVLFFSTLSVDPKYGILLSLIPFTYKVIVALIGGSLYLFNVILGEKK